MAALRERLSADAALADMPGKVLYSSASTLGPFPIYFLGTNPGGALPSTLRESLDDSTNGFNEYLDVSWEGRPPGQAKLQKQVTRFLAGLGFEPRDVPASNIVMTRSTGITTHQDMDGDARRCWPLHQIILESVQPRAILAFGSGLEKSAFAYLRAFLEPSEVESIPAEQPGFTCHAFKASLGTNSITVVVVPHLTRYSPYKKSTIMEWVKARLA
ncbi:hypothetical protein [Sphingobium sp. SA916]|uniref:hypothetical protein n=1 Tax=Sphingobium sp. SA916 TaxID=1851207 RepID=UPI000C9F576F|nr:hypothetical protein [Sphingobium sp. SA916]PNP99600.1 hypothetical protein A8G00_04790 [Sphingobium sp. SA916]